MAKNDASTNDEAAKAAAGKATDNTKAEAADKAADTTGAGQAGAAANVPSTEASKGAPGEAAQPSAQGNTKRRLVAIEVISRVDGFWRGGRQWTIAPQTVALSELSDAQLLQIKGEPLLIVRDVYEDER